MRISEFEIRNFLHSTRGSWGARRRNSDFMTQIPAEPGVPLPVQDMIVR
jgi:hypothetical protein